VVGGDDRGVVEEVGDGFDVACDQVAVLASCHRVAVVDELVVDVSHEIVQSSVVQGGEVGTVGGLECRVRHVGPSQRRLSSLPRPLSPSREAPCTIGGAGTIGCTGRAGVVPPTMHTPLPPTARYALSPRMDWPTPGPADERRPGWW